MPTYKSWVAKNASRNADDFKNIKCEWVEQPLPPLQPNDVQIKVSFSSVNFKDALAFQGAGKILRQLPLSPGIDAAGRVSASTSKNFKEGDEVFVTGCGLGENRSGGFSESITVPEAWVIAKPKKLSLKDAMTLGTAGFTAGLALHQLEKNDLRPETGPVLVTGASGGVGSLALILFKKKNYVTEAWSRKSSQENWLKKIGATKVVNTKDYDWKTRPLESALWAAAIDNVGGDILSYVLARIMPHGSIGSIGLAKSMELHTTVFPHILRGVNLLGISSATCPRPLREKIWQLLEESGADWAGALTNTLKISELPEYTAKMLAGETHGRAIVAL